MSIPSNLVVPNFQFDKNPLDLILHEAKLSWHFIAGDVSSAIAPAVLFTIAACTSEHLNLFESTEVVLKSFVYFWLYLWAFCLSNQVDGIEEDALNKPNRPIVEGKASYTSTQLRWIIAILLFTAAGFFFGVLEWAILWNLVIIFHNILGFSKHWVGKNLLMSLGILSQLAAAWQLVSPLTPSAWKWIFVLAGIIFPLVSVQDLRDINGDIANERKTFPIVFGEVFTRIWLTVLFLLTPLLIYFVLMLPAGASYQMYFCNFALFVTCLIIAFRIFFLRSSRSDHHTYILFTYWYCFAIASSIILL
jgi:4-hydroxybenzoate polyprenyltransferase